MKILVILQGPAYGDERAYNGLRLAGSLTKRVDVEVRGVTDAMLIPQVHRSSLDEATDWPLWADKVVTF